MGKIIKSITGYIRIWLGTKRTIKQETGEGCLIKEVTEVFREMTFAQRCAYYQE